MADALLVPVRMGVARPTAPFALVSINSDAVQVRNLIVFIICEISVKEDGSNHSLMKCWLNI